MTPRGPVTEEDLHTLRHMLGINKQHVRDPEPYRNYYAANAGDPHLVSLAERGLVRLARPRGGAWGADLETYVATDEGIRLARESARARAWPKRKRVYWRFLDVSDVCPGLTFREFLTAPEYAESRRSA